MFEVSLVSFHFVSADIPKGFCVYLDCRNNEYKLKQAASLYFNLGS